MNAVSKQPATTDVLFSDIWKSKGQQDKIIVCKQLYISGKTVCSDLILSVIIMKFTILSQLFQLKGVKNDDNPIISHCYSYLIISHDGILEHYTGHLMYVARKGNKLPLCNIYIFS